MTKGKSRINQPGFSLPDFSSLDVDLMYEAFVQARITNFTGGVEVFRERCRALVEDDVFWEALAEALQSKQLTEKTVRFAANRLESHRMKPPFIARQVAGVRRPKTRVKGH